MLSPIDIGVAYHSSCRSDLTHRLSAYQWRRNMFGVWRCQWRENNVHVGWPCNGGVIFNGGVTRGWLSMCIGGRNISSRLAFCNAYVMCRWLFQCRLLRCVVARIWRPALARCHHTAAAGPAAQITATSTAPLLRALFADGPLPPPYTAFFLHAYTLLVVCVNDAVPLRRTDVGQQTRTLRTRFARAHCVALHFTAGAVVRHIRDAKTRHCVLRTVQRIWRRVCHYAAVLRWALWLTDLVPLALTTTRGDASP